MTTLICPACKYDVTSLVREDGTATCPECGSELERYSKSRTVSRWDRVGLYCTCILIAPALVFIAIIALGSVLKSQWLSSAAAAAHLLTTAGLMIWFIQYEADKRLWWSNPPPRFKPRLWILVPFLIVFSVACIAGEYFLLLLWVWSQMS